MNRRFGITLAAGAFLASVFAPAPANAQLWTWTKDQLAEYTKAWTGDRLPDGRPKVSDILLQRAKGLGSEEAEVRWSTPGGGRGMGGSSSGQFVDGLEILQPKTKLVGRAFTLQFMPMRGDLGCGGNPEGGRRRRGLAGALDQLQPGDVLVVDFRGQKDSGAVLNDTVFLLRDQDQESGGAL